MATVTFHSSTKLHKFKNVHSVGSDLRIFVITVLVMNQSFRKDQPLGHNSAYWLSMHIWISPTIANAVPLQLDRKSSKASG